MPPGAGTLIEREAEMSQLLSLVRSGGSGDATVAIVTGEPGAGKSRLAAEFAAEFERRGGVAVTGWCAPVSSSRVAFGPILGILAQLLARRPDLPDSVTDEVWSSLRPLADGSAPTTDTGPLATTRVLAAIVELMSAASETAPLLVVVEDAHWADPATLDALSFAARLIDTHPVSLLVTARSTGGGRSSQSRRVLTELRRLPRTVDVPLGPLSDAGTRAIVEREAPRIADDLAARVVDLADGNPFYAQLLAHQPHPDRLPREIGDLLLGAVGRQASGARDLLIQLRVLGDRSDARLLADALGVDLDALTSVAAALVDEGLLVTDRSSVAFRHALVGEAVDDDILPSERALAHARAADALLRSGAAESPERGVELAEHLLACGRTAEAVAAALRGARHAVDVLAFADACENYDAVLRLWSLAGGGAGSASAAADVDLTTVFLEAIDANRWAGRLDRARALAAEARARALVPVERARLEHSHARVMAASGRLRDALGMLRVAESLTSGDTDRERHSAILASLAQTEMTLGEARAAATTADRAIAEAGDDVVALHAGITRAACRAQLGEAAAAVDDLRALLPEVRRRGDLELVIRCYGNLAFATGVAGRPSDVLRVSDEAIEVCRLYGPVTSAASTIVSNYCTALVAAGRWEEARQVATTGIEGAGGSPAALFLATQLAQVAALRGDWQSASAILDEARPRIGDSPYAFELAFVDAEIAAWTERPADAIRIIGETLDDLDEQEDQLLVLDACRIALRASADALQHSGRSATVTDARGSAAARELHDKARRVAGSLRTPLAAAASAACDAESDRARGRDTSEAWHALAALERDLGRPFDEAYALARAGACEVHELYTQRARDTLLDARRRAVDLGAAPLAALVDAVARRASILLMPEGSAPSLAAPAAVPSPTTSAPVAAPEAAPHGTAAQSAGPGDEHPGGLTRREVQVLRLVAAGATNRSIGQALFISDRTVAVHVGNILAKLGVANRTEAAHLARGFDLERA
ncbi:helix-turn-helix transcriptional regulator [Frondihabitans australicus]|uniref:Regulatory LuxR family protein n=1 Tax=Frondihabitans australicus TaxID=386892 RepID=A0A495ILH5_9MICO|nr:LuxR family transcriptional regulator [Frondihabitans australicus]RKR76580.1 regulatory LuxR family protein [Frondihabitans australicus]